MMSSVCCKTATTKVNYNCLHRSRRPTARVCAFFLTLFLVIAFNVNVATARRDHDDDGTTRQREHFDEILLRPDPYGNDDNSQSTQEVLQALRRIYHEKIKPVEEQFQYADLRRHVMSEADIHSKPIVLVVGPWSTGKSTLINYILGIEDQLERLYTGAEPTTADFTVLSYGDDYRTIEGLVLATDSSKPFSSMEKFGQTFLEHLLGIEINAPLLRNVTFIDTPGILENRRQQERGYPYNDVMRWLVHRSDLIFVIFDPTKLDVGYELETLFKQLKGKESVIRIILNKADSINEQELMRVYGALFWSLSPLINVTEAPRVYVGSFWSEPYSDEEVGDVLLEEEKSLLNDMYEVIRNRIYNKIAFLRQHAIRVRIHALLVDSYVAQYRKNKSFFRFYDETLAKQICREPIKFNVYKTILSHPNVSEYDLPDPEEYEEFFRINPLSEQRRLDDLRSYFSKKGPLDKLNEAISYDLPRLLQRYQRGEADNNKNWCKSRKSGIPCFGDMATDLWAMQKRYPNAGHLFNRNDDEEPVEKPLPKYRKVKKFQAVPEDVEEAAEAEGEAEEDIPEEEEEIEQAVAQPKPSKPAKQVVEKTPAKPVSMKRKGKPKTETKAIAEDDDEEELEKETEQEETSDEYDEAQSITRPIKTVSVAERVEEEIRQEKATAKIVAENVQTNHENIERIKVVKTEPRSDDTKPKEKTTEQKPAVKTPTKTETLAPEKRSQPDNVIQTKQPPVAQASVKPHKPAAPPPPTETLKKVEPVVPTVKDSISLPAASAGHVKKPSGKQHPSVEELIAEDDKKAHPCNKYRKNCDYKITSASKVKTHETVKAAAADKPKCLPYRKSCQSPADETKKPDKVVESPKVKAKVEHKPEVQSSKPTKEKAESVKQTAEGVKCLPYRKTCQPVVREQKPAHEKQVKETGARCPPYRKSCKQASDNDDHVTKEEKTVEKKTKPEKSASRPSTNDDEEKSAKSKYQKEEAVKQPKAPVSETKQKEKPKKQEDSVKTKGGVEAKKEESKKDSKPKEEDVKEERVSAKYKYRKIREDLPEEVKQKLREKLAKLMEAEQQKGEEKEEKSKKCHPYRKSCTIERKPVADSIKWDTVAGAFDFIGDIWDLIFSAHWTTQTTGTKSASTKCNKYRKTCTPTERDSDEVETKEEAPKKCPPYRKSCQNLDENEKPKSKHATSSEESRSSEQQAHENGSDENGIPPTQERQKYDSRELEHSHQGESQESAEKLPPKKEPVKQQQQRDNKKAKDKSIEVNDEEKKPTKETYKRRGVAAEMIEERKPDVDDHQPDRTDDKPALKEQVPTTTTTTTTATSAETSSSKESHEKESSAEETAAAAAAAAAKENVQRQQQKPVTAKEKYKKPSEQKLQEVKEAPVSKKSQDVKTSESPVRLTAREKYRKRPPGEINAEIKNKAEDKVKTGTKCLIYRKSCQKVEDNLSQKISSSSESKPTTAPKINTKSSSEQSAKEKYRKHVEEPTKKCLPYRKSCTVTEPESKSESVFASSPSDKHQYRKEHISGGDQPVKCLPYRKSCQNKEKEEVVNRLPEKDPHKAAVKDTITVTSKTPKSYSSSADSGGQKKCLPYRKSCTVPTVTATTVSSGQKKDVGQSKASTGNDVPQQSSLTASGHCIKYRKSCADGQQQQQVKKNLTNKDVIYVVDKETGKQKKLCRKKKNGDSESNGAPVPNADSLTSKMQNKWKKNAQLDSVMAA